MDVAPRAAARLRRRDQPQGALPPRPEPGQLPAGLHPRPRRAVVRRRRTWTPSGGTSSPAAARSSPTPPAAARPSTPPSAGSSPSCSPTTRSVPIPRDDELYSTQGRLRPLRRPVHQGRRRRQGLSRSSRASRSTATGRSSTPSTTSAAPWSATRGSTARATPTRAPCKIAANIVIYSTLP